jgi:hypothetical protein
MFERTRLNEFATWAAIETRVADMLPKRATAAIEVAASVPAPAPKRELVP